MAHAPETRLAVRSAYLEGLALELAAVKAGVPIATARRWKTSAKESGDDWDRLKNVQMLAAGGGMEQALGRVVAMVVAQSEATMRLLELDTKIDPLARTQAIASLSDSLNKTAAVAGRLMPQASRLAVAGDVIKRLSDFIGEHHPAQGAAFAELLEPFGEEIARAYA